MSDLIIIEKHRSREHTYHLGFHCHPLLDPFHSVRDPDRLPSQFVHYGPQAHHGQTHLVRGPDQPHHQHPHDHQYHQGADHRYSVQLALFLGQLHHLESQIGHRTKGDSHYDRY